MSNQRWKPHGPRESSPATHTAAPADEHALHLRTNLSFTLKAKPIERRDLDDFVKCFHADNRHERRNPRARLTAELLASTEHPGNNAHSRAFVVQGGGCRVTFFNYRRRLAGAPPQDGA